jgi:NADH-quinone oxidoreductase subunit A
MLHGGISRFTCRGALPISLASAESVESRRHAALLPSIFSGFVVRSSRMDTLLREYLPILIFLGIAIGLATVIVLASLVVARQSPDSEKLSPYECGFEPFEDARSKFDVRFYLVAILFIIFDLEVAFLFPWAVTLGKLGMFGFWSMITFLGVLTIGFIYEWRKGALEWE